MTPTPDPLDLTPSDRSTLYDALGASSAAALDHIDADDLDWYRSHWQVVLGDVVLPVVRADEARAVDYDALDMSVEAAVVSALRSDGVLRTQVPVLGVADDRFGIGVRAECWHPLDETYR
jgi:hypothetical protein